MFRKLFYAIGKFVPLHKTLLEDAHVKAIEGCRKCDAGYDWNGKSLLLYCKNPDEQLK